MIWAVVVGAAADGYRKSIGSVVSKYQKVSRCLGRTVWAACVNRSLLCEEQVRSVKWQITVNLISGNLMVTFDSVFTAGIHKNSSTDDVCVQENLRVLDGTVNVALSREVYNHIRMFFLKKLVNCFTVCDALFYKTEVWVVHNRCQSRKITCIGKAVQTDDAVVRVFF